MFKFLQKYFPDPLEVEKLGGATRSGKWPAVRDAHLKSNPLCALCGGKEKVTVHHILPFHLHPEYELDPSNLITLCEGNTNINCHLVFGHFENFRTKYNPDIVNDAKTWIKRLN